MMKALVTGASGFIGSTLIEELGTLGFDVYALMRKSSSSANLEGMKYTRIEGDISDSASLKRAVAGMDYVFHLAGTIAAPTRAAFFQHNAGGTENVAKAVAEINPGLSRFVFVSSLAAGGPMTSLAPRTESQTDKPVSAYGESKLAAERSLLKYKDAFPISIIRPPMVYGPKDRGVFVVIQTVSKNLMPIIQGKTEGGHKYYSSIHAKDLVRGIVQAAVAPKDKIPSGEIFYLSSNDFHTYRQFLDVIAEKLDCSPLRIKVPRVAVRLLASAGTAAGFLSKKTYPLNLDKLNEILPDYWICSSDKAKKMLGFSPEFDLENGMANTIDWYKKQRWL